MRDGVRSLLLATVLLSGMTLGTGTVRAEGPPRPLTAEQVVRMSAEELECRFRNGRCVAMPEGFAKGRPIWITGSKLAMPAARLTRTIWQGKIIRDDGTIRNRILGLPIFTAELSFQASWLDGQPCQVMDYEPTSKIFAAVRDEVREIAPGIFLGITWLRDTPQPRRAMFFVLAPRNP
ncbi:hypothetical protein [Tuwongella immobilis]|uniref:Uncharacterized protein n=1 Tax=Tuwongella immobilis TaxID=692036 RepID=A0A6C2YI12_9BACT|nr:hypothetical protein [Tuwongella immobilis]VIP01056.1 Uncharacterized protein OS=Singulisphaera acidiphila (strain ATCC BAA-1392 / DSM 18658 / VKM B-2454 / MOB10) GN=Sinac_2856 PE=4 SV=1 [Tuwongella immobilis]VTR97537.1 Uncharacterized protein OS=Singulisphaera acidiphila (strain ATCC BAA-1392 / DSM 18658 / VKM B-2454 / MOB10) GN=Sinac_2856 PE=4 SV=1 [Tuwongella immobilis]